MRSRRRWGWWLAALLFPSGGVLVLLANGRGWCGDSPTPGASVCVTSPSAATVVVISAVALLLAVYSVYRAVRREP